MAYKKIRKKKRTTERGEVCEEERFSRERSEAVAGGMIEDAVLNLSRMDCLFETSGISTGKDGGTSILQEASQ